MARTVISALAGLGLGIVIAGSANAATYTVSMWGGSKGAKPSTQADKAHVPTTRPDVTFSYNGAIIWAVNERQNTTDASNLVKNFIKSAHVTDWSSPSGAYLDESAWLNSSLSKKGDDYAAFFEIQGSYSGSIASGTIIHDDGASLYVDNGTVVFESPSETVAKQQSFTLPGGAHTFTLDYVEGNGAPTVLLFNISATPEPATWSMMMVGVGGMGAALRARRRKVPAA